MPNETHDGRKLVLDAHETITLRRWQVDLSHARRCQFTTGAKSYGQFLDDPVARRQHAWGFVPGFCPEPKR